MLIVIIILIIMIIVPVAMYLNKPETKIAPPPTAPKPPPPTPEPTPPTPPIVPDYTGRFFTIGYIPPTDPNIIYSSEPGELSYTSSTSIKAQIDAILLRKNISKPYNYVSLWNDRGFRVYNFPPGVTIPDTLGDPFVITYPIEAIPLLSPLKFYRAGYVTSHKEVYEKGRGSLSFKSSISIKDQIDTILLRKNISVEPYNIISIFEDGGFRVYNTNPGDTLSTSTDTYAATYSVEQISNFANISKFGAGGDNGMMILFLLLVVAAIVYYLYTQGKIKIPSFEQRMAQFGRTIRSLRRR